MNPLALVINLVSVGLVFYTGYLILSHIKRFHVTPAISFGLPLVGIIAIVLFSYQRMWVSPTARTAKVYLDTINKIILVCFNGFHFLPWYATKESDEINFQKHQEMNARRKDNNAIKFKTSDALDVECDLFVLYNRRKEQEALEKSLGYTMDGLGGLVKAIIIARLSSLGACNSYDTLRYNKDQVTAWVAGLFAGSGQISPFEDYTGTDIQDPVLEDFDLTKESQEIYSKNAKIDVFITSTKRLQDEAGLKPEESSHAAQVIVAGIQRTITTVQHTYDVRGLPPGVSVFAPGSDGGVAVSTPKGGK